MASLNFYLEKRKRNTGNFSDCPLPVMLYFSYRGRRRFQWYTGEKARLTEWDRKTQRIKEGIDRGMLINAYLDKLSRKVWELYREAKNSGIPATFEYFRNGLRDYKTGRQVPFFDVFFGFIDRNNSKWSITTFRKVKTNYNHLKCFAAQYGESLRFESIDRAFFEEYIRYFQRKGHQNSTIKRNLDVLKWFLNWALRKGYHRNRYFKEYDFPWKWRPDNGRRGLYLSRDELLRFLAYDFEDPGLDTAKDIFCFLCFTGLKYGHLRNFRTNGILSDRISIFLPGSGITITAPLNKYATGILEKYRLQPPGNGLVFPAGHNVSVNRQLKRAAGVAGLDREVEVTHLYGPGKENRVRPLHQLISMKVAGQTFAVHALRLGIAPEAFISSTGQKSYAGIPELQRIAESLRFREMQKIADF